MSRVACDDELGLFLERKQRRLAGMGADGHDDPAAERRGGAHDVHVAVGDGIERSGVEPDRTFHEV